MVEETPVFTKSYAFLSCFYVFVVFSYSRIRSFQIRHVYTILYIFFDNYTILYASSTLSSPLNSRFVTWCRVIYEIEMREERNVIPSPTIHLSPWQTNCTRRPLSLSPCRVSTGQHSLTCRAAAVRLVVAAAALLFYSASPANCNTNPTNPSVLYSSPLPFVFLFAPAFLSRVLSSPSTLVRDGRDEAERRGEAPGGG